MSEEVETKPPDISSQVEDLAKEYSDKEEPKKKRGRRSKAEIEGEKQAEFAAQIQASAGVIALGIVGLTTALEKSYNWSAADDKEIAALSEATFAWIQARAMFLSKFLPEIMLVMAWSGYLIPRIQEAKKRKQTETPKQTDGRVEPVVESVAA